jgi:hypothetical protein
MHNGANLAIGEEGLGSVGSNTFRLGSRNLWEL